MVSRCCGGNADLEKNLFLELSIHISLLGTFAFPLLIYFMYLVFKVEGDGHLNPFSPKSDQHQFFSKQYQDIIKRKVRRINKNDEQRRNALIFYQVLSTDSVRQFMEISVENLYLDIGA